MKTRILLLALICSNLLYGWSCGISRPEFETTPASRYNALLSGQVRNALVFYSAQAEQAETQANSSLFAWRYWEIAAENYQYASRTARESGDNQKALLYGEKALQTAEKTQSPRHMLKAILELVWGYGSVRDFEKVDAFLERAFEILRDVPPNSNVRANWEGILNDELGRVFMRKGEYSKATEAYLYGIHWNRIWMSRLRFNDPAMATAKGNIIMILSGLGIAYRRAGKLEEALEQYREALKSMEEWHLKYPYENSLYEGMGEIYLQQKHYSAALENFTKALAVAENQMRGPAIRLASTRVADALRLTGKHADAIPYYRKAIQQVESTRSLIQSEEYRQRYFEGVLNAYVSMIEALSETGDTEGAFSYSERARSRVFLDLLGSKVQLSREKGGLLEEERSLQDRIAGIKTRLAGDETAGVGEAGLRRELAEAEKSYSAFLAKVRKEDKEQASLMSVEPLTLKQVQELLDAGQTMLEYFVTDSEIFIWLVEKDKLNFHRLKTPKMELAKAVKILRENVSDLGDAQELKKVSMSLYHQLIEPVLSRITGKELVIIPHDVLHYLPFQALLGPDGKYLIEKYPISYLSSASLLQFVKEKRKAAGEKVLAFGNPDLGDPEKDLEFAELEAQEVKAVYPGANVFVRKEATEEKSKVLSGNHDILHFATHAQLNEGDPLSSAVLLAKDEKEDGRLEMREIFGMDLKANLVVLSGCETALGKLSTGDELVGLTRAFIYAGTPSVVASLWKVDDSSTAHLMSNFYRNLKTMTKVEALRQAQLALIRSEGRSDLLAKRGVGGVGKLGETPIPKPPSQDSISVLTSHPYFWAPFILVGDGK